MVRLIYSKYRRWSTDERLNDPRYNFGANPTLDELIAQQGKGTITDLRVLDAALWPDNEPIEDFLAALHDWRGHKKTDPTARASLSLNVVSSLAIAES